MSVRSQTPRLETVRPQTAEMQALAALRQEASLRTLGCRFDRGLSGGVCITLGGRGYGAWWYEDGVYKYATVAHRAVEYAVPTVDDVVARTEVLAREHVRRNSY